MPRLTISVGLPKVLETFGLGKLLESLGSELIEKFTNVYNYTQDSVRLFYSGMIVFW